MEFELMPTAGPSDWKVVQPRKRKKSTEVTADYSSDDSQSSVSTIQERCNSSCSNSSHEITNVLVKDRKPLYSILLSNLPKHLATPKGLSQRLTSYDSLELTNVISKANGDILLKTTSPRIKSSLERIKSLTALKFNIGQLRPCQQVKDSPKKPSFSCVLTAVDLDVTMEDIKEELTKQNLPFTNVWRIKAKRTDKYTRLVRIISTEAITIDTLLTRGFKLFYKHHRVEASHPPKPQPIQCWRCSAFHLASETCKKPISCKRCSKHHSVWDCDPKTTPKCANCNGDHMASYPDCPERPKTPTNPAAAAPLALIPEPEKESTTPASTEAVLRLITATMINAMPQLKEKIASIITPLAAQLFNIRLTIAYSRSKFRIGCCPVENKPQTKSTTNHGS